jgi:hypothetical protein
MLGRIAISLLLLASVSFALTQDDCRRQLEQCISSVCVQAGCTLEGGECSCAPEQQAQMDELMETQCEPSYFSCMDAASARSESGCCGTGLVLLFGGAAASFMLALRR